MYDLPCLSVMEGLRKRDVQQCWLAAGSHPRLGVPALADGIPSVRLVLYCCFCCSLVRQTQDWDCFTLFTQHIARHRMCRYFCYHSPMVLFGTALEQRGWFLVFLFSALSYSYFPLSRLPAHCSVTRLEHGHFWVSSR
ncbi:hypothetical protein PISMIDRAFT_477574 [Pisolithus microcarpus 441]|uniref:Uncharacterized protein n=1 Tax=Pisolithus microcarpus 441 TaxID=765257 RepID=A0A0C9Z1I1_9AGAM|nr:hypothetical protein PISMIDRAFT_477574 [Pisolithus microcarpus 441]